jgi:hypothetical protein
VTKTSKARTTHLTCFTIRTWRRCPECIPIFHGTNIDNMIIILHDQTTAYNCRSISWIAAAQAIKYKVSPIKNSSNKVDRWVWLTRKQSKTLDRSSTAAPSRHHNQKEGKSMHGSKMHPSCMSLIRISHNPWRMSSCHHRARNDGGTTSRGEILDKTHNNQSLNPNDATTTDYNGSTDVGTPLDAPLLGSYLIHGSMPKVRCHST